jgi:hypothetical protein
MCCHLRTVNQDPLDTSINSIQLLGPHSVQQPRCLGFVRSGTLYEPRPRRRFELNMLLIVSITVSYAREDQVTSSSQEIAVS